jgi:hypothetical protein
LVRLRASQFRQLEDRLLCHCRGRDKSDYTVSVGVTVGVSVSVGVCVGVSVVVSVIIVP